MKRKPKNPKRPTRSENDKLRKFFWMQPWEFDKLIASNCTEIESTIIDWEDDMSYAYVYGVTAIYTTTKKQCISNFFIRYGHRVYQERCMTSAAEILSLIRKEIAYDQYQDKKWKERVEKNKKLEQEKTRIPILKTGSKQRQLKNLN